MKESGKNKISLGEREAALWGQHIDDHIIVEWLKTRTSHEQTIFVFRYYGHEKFHDICKRFGDPSRGHVQSTGRVYEKLLKEVEKFCAPGRT